MTRTGATTNDVTRTDAAGELAAFLRTRRERLTPADAGLPTHGRARRTPGLRREEVAELAGVSVDYVVRLEQGRGLNPSVEVLEALARALRLSEDERAYLFNLSRQRPGDRLPSASERADAGAARLVHDLSPLPAMLVDHRFDILAWNAEMVALMVDFGALPPEQRNSIGMCLLHPAMRDFYLDRELIIREGIADLRAAWAAHPDDARLGAMINEWSVRSPEFARLWEQRDVRVNGRGCKRLRHPEVGPLSINYEVLTPLADAHQRLVIYRAADPASQAALDRLAAAPATA
jgi:transcriptional regulator with XRE-family HTH domain